MFFLADVRDSPECDVHAEDGRIVFGEKVTNPAMACPDAFAWKLMVDSVGAGFWENWSTNRQTWPSDPWPRCAPGATGSDCCASVEISNSAWPQHCPVFPGPTPGVPEYAPTEPAIAAQMTLAEAAPGDVDADGKVDWDDVPGALKSAVIGGVAGELTYRNQPMVDYIFDRELYSTDGLARVFEQFSRATRVYAPHWPEPDNPDQGPRHRPGDGGDHLPDRLRDDQGQLARGRGRSEDRHRPLRREEPVHHHGPPADRGVEQAARRDAGQAEAAHPPLLPHLLEGPAGVVLGDLRACRQPGALRLDRLQRQLRLPQHGDPRRWTRPGAAISAIPARNFTPPHQTDKVGGFDQAAFVLGERYLDVDEISGPLDAIFAAFDVATGSGINRTGRPTAARRRLALLSAKGEPDRVRDADRATRSDSATR